MATTILGILNRLVDLFVDRIIIFTDYFLIRKHITLSETLLFLLSTIRMFWFLIFGVVNENYDMIWGREVWVPVYLVLNVTHFASFFQRSLRLRWIALYLQAFVWCFLTFISLMSANGRTSTSTPSLFVFTLFALFIAVRLYREETPVDG